MHPKGKNKKVCECKEIQEWKLEYMGESIFRNLTQNSENRLELTRVLMNKIKIDPHEEIKIKNKINKLKDMIEEVNSKLDRLLDMYLNQLINTTYYEGYQNKFTNNIEQYQIEINKLENKLNYLDPPEIKKEKARKSIQKLLDINYNGLDEKLIEEFVEKIIVHKDYFEWKLNFTDETVKLKIVGKNKRGCLLEEYMDIKEKER